MTATRNGSVLLDSTKIIAHAASLGISSKNAFQDHYNNIYEKTGRGADGAPVKAWEGTRMRRTFAQTIAELFGLSNYIPLLENQGSPAWSDLIHNQKYQSSFMEFVSVHESDLGMIDFSGFSPTNTNNPNIDKISINERWYLNFEGTPGQFMMVVIQSNKEFLQFAPLDIEEFKSMIPSNSKTLRYPSKGILPFDKGAGLGWRRFIAIKSTYIPISPKSFDTGFSISPIELETFAIRLTQNQNITFDVDQYEFEIVDTSTKGKSD